MTQSIPCRLFYFSSYRSTTTLLDTQGPHANARFNQIEKMEFEEKMRVWVRSISKKGGKEYLLYLYFLFALMKGLRGRLSMQA